MAADVVRQIVLDTETTGLEAKDGHRIIEIGGVELVGRRLTERRLHRYVNPDRAIDTGALAVHGLVSDFLMDKPRLNVNLPQLEAEVQAARDGNFTKLQPWVESLVAELKAGQQSLDLNESANVPATGTTTGGNPVGVLGLKSLEDGPSIHVKPSPGPCRVGGTGPDGQRV